LIDAWERERFPDGGLPLLHKPKSWALHKEAMEKKDLGTDGAEWPWNSDNDYYWDSDWVSDIHYESDEVDSDEDVFF
jgi:hypothetical protein